MKLIKRTLSLLLALLLAMGFASSISVLSAEGAEKYRGMESIGLLKSLGIMEGYEDGRMDLEGFLTRAQAAKIIYTARMGAGDNAKMFDRPEFVVFADVPGGYWAAGYINYCALQGYVSGRGGNRFDPEGKITGFEFMKILLAALGYDAEAERFSNNSGWQLYTVTAAAEAGLAEGFSGNPASYVTRGEAAILTANMIFAKTVAYNTKNQRVTSENTFGEKYLKLKVNTGVVVANGVTDSSLYGKTEIRVPDNRAGSSGVYSVGSGLDEIGQTVTIYTKGNSFTDIYGTVNISPENKVLTTYSRLSDADVSEEGSFRRWLNENGIEIGESEPVYITKGTGPESSAPIVSNAAGERLRVIDNNGDGKADYIIKIKKTAAMVLSISVEENTVEFDTLGGVWNMNDTEGLTGVAEGDIVLAFEYGGKLRLNKAGSVSGKMSRSVPLLAKATINNIEYISSDLAFEDIDGSETDAETFTQWISDRSNFMKERVFFLDDGGNIIYIKTPESEKPAFKYAMIIDSGCSRGNEPFRPQAAAVKLLYADGSSGTAQVNEIDGTLVRYMPEEDLFRLFDPETAHESLVTGRVFGYTGNADGSVNLRTARNQTEAPGTITRSNPNLVPNSIYADAKTTFISYNAGKDASITYTGIKNVPSYSSVSGAVLYEGKVAKTVFITSAVSEPVDPVYTYITGGSTAFLNEDGNVVYSYPVFENGKAGTLIVDEPNGDLDVGLYSYTVSEWGVFSFRPAGDVRGTISFAGDGIIAVGNTAYVADDTTQVNKVNPDGTVVKSGFSALREGAEVLMVLSPGVGSAKAAMIFVSP